MSFAGFAASAPAAAEAPFRKPRRSIALVLDFVITPQSIRPRGFSFQGPAGGIVRPGPAPYHRVVARSYDVDTREGAIPVPPVTQLHVVLNFLDDLKPRVPIK